MSCGGGTIIKPDSVTIEATPEQHKTLIDIYCRGAALAIATLNSKVTKILPSSNPIPTDYRLTMEGCNNNHQGKISSMMNTIYAVVRNVALSQDIILDTKFSKNQIFRTDQTYNGSEFGFMFTTSCDSLSVIIVKQVCPLAGVLVKKYCVDHDQWAEYTDGECGVYYQQIKQNSTQCGYVPAEKAGLLKSKSCRGTDQWAEYHDGNYGFYHELFIENSIDCGYVPPIASGTLKTKFCKGNDQWATFHDGNYGTYDQLFMEKSSECGYVAPPAAGTKVGTKCVGKDLYDIVNDGNGGTRQELNTPNSPSCGYAAPRPGGEVLTTKCVGKDLYNVVSDGNGGTKQELNTPNSPSCGYVPPPISTVPPPPPPGIPPPTSGSTTKTVNYYAFPSGPHNSAALGQVTLTYNASLGGVVTMPYNGHMSGNFVMVYAFYNDGDQATSMVQAVSGGRYAIGEMTQGNFDSIAYLAYKLTLGLG